MPVEKSRLNLMKPGVLEPFQASQNKRSVLESLLVDIALMNIEPGDVAPFVPLYKWGLGYLSARSSRDGACSRRRT